MTLQVIPETLSDRSIVWNLWIMDMEDTIILHAISEKDARALQKMLVTKTTDFRK